MRFLVLAVCFGTLTFGEDITLPLNDGTILISAQFIRPNEYQQGSDWPELTLTIKNQTSYPWQTLKVQFDIGGLCNGEPRQWTVPVLTSLGWSGDHPFVKEYKDVVFSLVGKVDGCKSEIIKAKLILAENSKTRIDGSTDERVDLEKQRSDLDKQLQEIKAKRDAEAAAKAQEDRQAADEKAKKDAVRRRAAEEQRRKQAEADAKRSAEENARAAEEQRKTRAACAVVYQNTIDKKIKDLTVREEQQVRACRGLGLYPPP